MEETEQRGAEPCLSASPFPSQNTVERPAFLADRMLGKLARWLRIMGYDTEYAEEVDDSTLARVASEKGRILLTRDRALHSRKSVRSIYISAADPEEQLRALAFSCHLVFDETRMRCSLCNGIIVCVPRDQAAGRVPDGVLARHSRFYVCGKCGKIYWRGSHWDRIMTVMNGVVAPGL